MVLRLQSKNFSHFDYPLFDRFFYDTEFTVAMVILYDGEFPFSSAAKKSLFKTMLFSGLYLG